MLGAATIVVVGAGCSGDSDEGADTGAAGSAPSTSASTRGGPTPSAGCGTSEQGAVVDEEHALTVEGTDRRYLLTVPSSHDGADPLPLVFDTHGLMEGADIHTRHTGYSDLAEEEGFVVVYPHGTGTPVQWPTSPDEADSDLAYFDALLQAITADLCIDESRIYATGLSMGAMFTSILLCTRADVLAAAAPVAGLLDHDGCEPDRSVPIRTYHGTDDPIVLFNGGFDLSSIGGPTSGATTAAPPDLEGDGYPANAAAWAARNGCAPGFTDTEVTEEVIHRVYDCPEGADVEFVIVVGGGHAWPGSEFSRDIENVVGHTTFDVDATRDGWDFMSRFTNP